MKSLSFILVAFVLVLASSCTTATKGQNNSVAKMQIVPNSVMIHKSPMVGDFAVLRIQVFMTNVSTYDGLLHITTGDTVTTTEITGLADDMYILKISSIMSSVSDMEKSVQSEDNFEYRVTKDGMVKAAFYIEGAKRSPMRIAQPGSYNYTVYDYQAMTKRNVTLQNGSKVDCLVDTVTYDMQKQMVDLYGKGVADKLEPKGQTVMENYVDPAQTVPFCLLGYRMNTHMIGNAFHRVQNSVRRESWSEEKATMSIYGTGYAYLESYGNRNGAKSQ